MMRLVTDGCLQYLGGAGYLWESPTAAPFRDSRLASIGGGADEVMLQIISKLNGHPAPPKPQMGAMLSCLDVRNPDPERERPRLHVTLNRPK
jgi:hypothetical protein